MKMKKFLIMSLSALMLISASGCSTSNEAEAPDDSATQEVMVIDKESKEITMLAEVNGKYFTESTRHGVVFKDGSNGEKSVLRGLADEKEFYNALIEIGAVAGDNLTAEDMKAGPADGKSVEGDKLIATVTWDGLGKEIPFEDIIKASEERPMDLRFGGNLASAEKNNTGCVLCLDSCATGITSDASYPTGTTQNKTVDFFGDDSVLPEDGTQVKVIFRLA